MSRRARSHRIRTGLDDLDEVLGGLLTGDNVVWVSNDPELCAQIEGLMISAAPTGEPAVYVAALASAAELRQRFRENLIVIDARAGSPFFDPILLEQAIFSAVKKGAMRFVFDGLDLFAHHWGAARAIGFFKRVCPRLFDAGTIAYWRVSRSTVGRAGIDDIGKVTQCVFEVDDKHLRVIKAEGHAASVQGRLFRVSKDDGRIRLHAERALGRLAESLRRLRVERSLTQADLARFSNVSSSAISQAEAGQRGLSLDTLLTLTDRLGIGLDDLLQNEQRPDYVLARRDRGTELGDSRFLLDDPSAGLRVYLLNLGPRERGTPPVKHKGAELVLVAQGLVLVDLGSSSPAVRAGDAILATRVPIIGWRNLLPDPSVLFWILRD